MKIIGLPTVQTGKTGTLDDAMQRRRSVRSFLDRPLSPEQLGQLLWSAQGVTLPEVGFRTVPSAGATYPLELYAVTPDGLFHYVSDDHTLEARGERDLRRELARASLNQWFVADAGVSIVITALLARTSRRYAGRAERYVILEAGHAAQNILLQAVALGLGAVPVGAFDDREVARLLALPPREAPLYYCAVGHAAVPGRES